MKKLVVLVGPTAVGKTKLALDLAEHCQSPIISIDSRQIYKGLEIGTAAPTKEELDLVRHYFIGIKSVDETYNVSQYEHEALQVIEKEFKSKDTLIATGGSMLYIDALCYGIDIMPDVNPLIREEIYSEYKMQGLEPLLEELKSVDSSFYSKVDKCNYKRVIHALEVYRTTGKPFSSFRTNSKKKRPFKIIKIGLKRNREILYERINDRVDKMMEDGLLNEAKTFIDKQHLNALNTVGYKELFSYLKGEYTLELAVEKIKRNTRVYAKQQMRWFQKQPDIYWINLDNKSNKKILEECIRILE